MRSFITCRLGLEGFAIQELEQFGITHPEKKKGYVLFESEKETLIRFLYKSGIAIRGGILFFEENIEKTLDGSKEKIQSKVVDVPYNDMFERSARFRVESHREGEHSFKSNEFERFLGSMIFNELEKKGFEPVVDLKKPDVSIFAQMIDQNLIVGMDLIGFDATKRDYKLFSSSHSIKGDIARAMALSGIKDLNKGVILDPFCSDGMVGIELALLSLNKSHNHYRKRDFLFKKSWVLKDMDISLILKSEDEKEKKDTRFNINCFDPLFHNLKSIQKNAKIAGVDKVINISRVDADMMDLKFEDKSIDTIVTVLPSKSRNTDFAKMKKQVETLFKQAEYILKKKRKIIILTDVEEYLSMIKEKGFNVDNMIDIGMNERRIYSLS